jgi:tetratricopeptide (TPR) repeat protein
MNLKTFLKLLVITIISVTICNSQVIAAKAPVKINKTSVKNKKSLTKSKKPVIKGKKVKQPGVIDQINNYIKAGDTQKALNLLNKAVLKDPYNAKLFSIAADIFYKNSQYSEAEMLARKALSINPNDTNCYLILGNILLKNFKTNRSYSELEPTNQDISIINEALRCFNAVIQRDMSSAIPHINLAKAYYAIDNKEKAYDELLKAKELAGNNSEALFQIGELLYECQYYEKSIKYLNKSLSLKLKDTYKAHAILAQIYEKLGSYENAQAEYIATLQINSKKPSQMLVGSAKYDDTQIINAGNFVSTPDKSPKTIDTDVLLVSGRFTEAREVYLKTLQQDSINSDALTGLAEIYYSQWLTGNYDAKKYYFDRPYFDKISPNILKLPLIKFRLAAEPEMTGKIRDAIVMVANNQSMEFSDRLDVSRALFLQGNFIGSKIKLQELLLDDLSDLEKLQVAKQLYLDQNYVEADNLARKIKQPEYYNYAKVIRNRVYVKVEEANAIFLRAKILYEDKKYPESIIEFKNQIKVYPTDKKAHLYLAYALQKSGKIEDAVKELNLYMNLETIYPSVKPELELKKIPVLVKSWENINTIK